MLRGIHIIFPWKTVISINDANLHPILHRFKTSWIVGQIDNFAETCEDGMKFCRDGWAGSETGRKSKVK